MVPEIYREGALQLTIEFDLAREGWVLELVSPPLWASEGKSPQHELVHTEIVIPHAAYEKGEVDTYLDALLAMHFDRLGLLQTGW